MLSSRGVTVGETATAAKKTLDGANMVADSFVDHAITRGLATGGAIFSRDSATFILSSADTPDGARDRISLTPLASVSASGGAAVLAAAVERGAMAGRDIGYRPSRIVAIGDAAFALNGALKNRANANLDLVMNAVDWLSGLEAPGGSGVTSDVVSTGLDRNGRIRFMAWTCLCWPLAAFALGMVARRRRR